MLFSISLGFGYAFYLRGRALAWFLVLLYVMGFGGANHTMYSLWLPEQYRTECRASAFGFTTSVGRFVGAVFTFLGGRRSVTLRNHRYTGGHDLARVSGGFSIVAVGRGNQGPTAARLTTPRFLTVAAQKNLNRAARHSKRS